MACLIAVNFSPFPIVSYYFRELQPKASAHRVVSSPWSIRASFRVISSACIRNHTAVQSLYSGHLIRVPSRDSFVLSPLYSDVSYCPQTLTGYWVGPDTEDGWGFVEAFIDIIL
ncbi:uncharacterized protein LOC110736051 [Chenopodium quinoa]|uniref:uncharacterized protein LOC110736051 n=1 Tax=Chenopodium quinoa TaxID=63459 RepID=UPI000B78BB40|nr:uncharacterized protein LOC110736051 [Chenopodium quinoa]